MNRTSNDRLTRLAAAVAVGAALLLAGCTAAESPRRSMLPFGKSAREGSLRKQLEADPFPTAQQAGLKPVN